jgi:hypothetical protein
MKHIRDAKKLMEAGNGPAALDVLDNLLELAPRNTEALRLKSQVLDHWGHFDVSLELLRRVANIEGPRSTVADDYDDRLREEREAMIFSEITPEGRWYFAFPRAQMWISLYGFFGCAAFLLMSSGWANRSSEALPELITAFFALVLLPWIGLIVTHLRGIKKILVGLEGIKICTPFSSRTHRWSSIGSIVVEYDPDLTNNHLMLRIFGTEKSTQPLEVLNIAEGKSVVRARRHFVRNVLAYVDCVAYLAKHDSVFTLSSGWARTEPAAESENTPPTTTKAA